MDRQDRKDTITQMHKDNILNAALELFEKNGFDKTTMDDIAKNAEYSKRTIYVYYDSKDEIYSYMVLKAFDELNSKLKSAVNENEDFMHKYHAICDCFFELKQYKPEYFNGVVKYINKLPSEGQTNTKEIFEEVQATYSILMDFFAKAQSDGIILDNLEPKRTVFLLINYIINAINLAFNNQEYLDKIIGSEYDEFFAYSTILALNAVLSVE